MLTQRFASDQLSGLLIDRADWHPYPTIAERAAWERLPATVRDAHIGYGAARLGYTWPDLPATLYLEFSRIGNRRNFEANHFARRGGLAALALAECMEGEGRFLDDIANGVWTICEESSWCLPAHISVQQAGNTLPDVTEPIVDLFAAETGSLLAWTSYLLGERLDQVSPLVQQRLQAKVQARILDPCLARDDFWWMGFVNERGRRVNNWNPWVCSNWLAANLLLEQDAGRRVAAVGKILAALDNFIDPYPRDGGCDEGPNYWGRAGASLFDNLELLHNASNGEIDLYGEPLIQEIGRYIYRAHIAGDYSLNFADASALVQPDPLLTLRYGQRIDDPAMADYGAWLAQRQDVLHRGIVQGQGDVPTSLGRALAALFALDALATTPAAPPLPATVWLGEIEVMAARDREGSTEGWFVAAKGGHNDESHNHNDIGNFVVYLDGAPLLVDAGVETYTAKTFSEQRYEIWTMQSDYHSLLPTVDGVQQLAGAQYAARQVEMRSDDAQASLTLDIAAAYPPEAKIAAWQRTVSLQRGQAVIIIDRYALAAPASSLHMSLITPCQVDLTAPGQIRLGRRSFGEGLTAAAGVVHYDASRMVAHSERIPISDERMGAVWGDSLTRVVLVMDRPAQEGELAFSVRRSL